MASVFELAQQINRKKQQNSGNQFFDNSMQVMQYLDNRSKEGTARKVKGMEVALGDFNKVYDNATLTDRMNVFEKRFGGNNLNKLNADERAAYDNAKIMMSRQMEQNTDFGMYQDKLKDTAKAMNDWMTSADGDTQPDPDVMNQILLDYMDTRANFSTKHKDRLSSQAFSYLNKEMDSIHEMGSFGIASMADDGILSQGEAKAMAQSLTTLDPKFISEYKIERKRTEGEGHQANVKVMDTTMKEHAFYKDLLGRISTEHPQGDGEPGYVDDKGNFHAMTTLQAQDLVDAAEIKLSNLDDKYKNNINNVEGKSYLEMSGFGHIADTGGGGVSTDPVSEEIEGVGYEGGVKVEDEIATGGDTTSDEVDKGFSGKLGDVVIGALDTDLGKAGIVLGTGAAVTNVDNVGKAVNYLTTNTAKAVKHIQVATNFTAPQITEFLESKQVKDTVKRIEGLEDKINNSTGKQKAYWKRQLNKVTQGRSAYWAKKLKVDPKKVDMLWSSASRNKWNIFNIKEGIVRGAPKLMKAIGNKYVIGNIVNEVTGGDMGIVSQLAVGYGGEKVAKSMLTKIGKIVSSPKGRRFLVKKLGAKVARKLIATQTAGSVVPVWGNVAMGIAGAGLVAKDVYDFIQSYEEEEEK